MQRFVPRSSVSAISQTCLLFVLRYERLLRHPCTPEETKEILLTYRQQLDPVKLLHSIREGQSALSALGSNEGLDGPGRVSLAQFLARLSVLWQNGEVRPTHRTKSSQPHNWRTRKDPFESAWHLVLSWLEANPEVTAKELFERLQSEYPGHYADGQLRTLQRRVKEWRHIMAKQLVYVYGNVQETPEKTKVINAAVQNENDREGVSHICR